MLIKLSDLLGKFKNTLLCTIKEYIHKIFTFLINEDSRLLFLKIMHPILVYYQIY